MKKIKIWYLLLTAFFYYPILLKMKLITYGIVYLVPLVFFVFHYQWLFGIIQRIRKSKLVYSVIAWGIITCAAIVVPIIMKTNDFSYLLNAPADIVKFAYRSLFLLGIFELYVSPEKDTELFMRYFIYSCCLYIMGTVVFLLLPGLKSFWINIISIPALDLSHIAKPYYLTRFGWSGFSGFSATLWCCMGVIFIVYLMIAQYERKERYLHDLCPLFLLLCGNMFYGRIGLLLSVLCIGILLLYFLSRRPYYIVGAFIVVAVGVVLLLFLKNHSQRVEEWYSWSFSIINNFFESGRIGTDSTDILFGRMFFLPDFETFVLGDGIFTMPDETYYMQTDSGLMRPMLFYGMFFALIGFYIYINMVMSLRNRTQLKKDPKIQILIVNLLLVWLLFEIKGATFYLMATYLLPIAILMTAPLKLKE